MAENEDKDKTEQASPYKLEQARKKGQVAKSMEINSLATLLAFTLLSMAVFPWISSSLSKQIRQYFNISGSAIVNPNSVVEMFIHSFTQIITVFSPLIVVLVFVSVTVTMLQTKPVFTTHPLKPDFKKLNPISGIKKLFSLKTLFETGKTCLKLCAISAFLYYGLQWIMSDLLASRFLTAEKISEYWFEKFKFAALIVILVLLPFAVVDLIFTKKEFAKKMRMSKRDIKDEVKRRDGDPEVRAKRKKIQNELLKKTSSISNIKDADVILTNPTHYAVALKYVPHKMIAPIVVAKGCDLFADKIKRIGLEYNVPIFRQPTLARKIYRESDIDHPILDSNYADIAPIFRWVFESKGKVF